MLLLLSICCYNAIELKKAINNNYDFCHKEAHRRLLAGSEPYCSSWMVEFSSIQGDVSSDEEVLRIVAYVAHFLFLIYMRDNLIKL